MAGYDSYLDMVCFHGAVIVYGCSIYGGDDNGNKTAAGYRHGITLSKS